MPLNRPQWRAWVMQDFRPGKTLVLQETHHSLGDGISLIHWNLQMDDIYDTSKVVRMASPNPYFKWILRAMLIYTIPKYFLTGALLR